MSGWVLSQQGSPTLAGYVPFAFSGITQFQSHRLAPPGHTGAVAWWNTGSDNGTIANRSGTGWYDLTADCKGTMALQDSAGGELHLQFFVGQDGNALYLANTDTVSLPPPAPAIPAFVLGMTANRIEQD